MEALGLVERVREEPDRRTVHVQLTPAGLARLDGIFADVMAGDESLLADWRRRSARRWRGCSDRLDVLEPGTDVRQPPSAP